MGNTFTSLDCHLVFSTKNREPVITHEIEDRVWKFLGGIVRKNGMKPIRIGGMPDHIHGGGGIVIHVGGEQSSTADQRRLIEMD